MLTSAACSLVPLDLEWFVETLPFAVEPDGSGGDALLANCIHSHDVIATAVLASVTVRERHIGDRLGGPWRGFLAGLIHLCCCGAFLFGRIVMPEPVFSAFIAGAIYCAIRGYERRQGRRGWFAGFWIFVALA